MGVTSVDTVVVCVMTDWAQTALVSAALVDGGFDGSELVCVTILDEALFGIGQMNSQQSRLDPD